MILPPNTMHEAFDNSLVNVPQDVNYHASWLVNMLERRALKNEGIIYHVSDNGYATVTEEEFFKELASLNGRLIEETISDGIDYSNSPKGFGARHSNHKTYLFSNGYLYGQFVNEGECNIYANTLDKELAKRIGEISSRLLTKSIPKKGYAYVLVQKTNGEIELSTIGVAAVDFKEQNYTNEVVQGYRHIIEDLKSKTPCGRISIFDGIPGTGKTFLIRALLNDVPDALFIIVTPDMIPMLSSPSMVKVLIERKNGVDGPTVFVVEDADQALAKRGIDNMSSVSAVLNLSDGLLGNMLDLRLVATTNAERADIDDAVMRDGRLCRRIEVAPLQYEQAIEAFKGLDGDPTLLNKTHKEYTLGQLYRLARNDRSDGIHEITRKGELGFGK